MQSPCKTRTEYRTTELDALELDVEEEGPSYLADLNKAPDFVDEPPVELPEVRCSCVRRLCFVLMFQ